jgi:electron transfer flavoprotein beta subunit
MTDIVVCIKQVPDTAEVRINPATNNLIRDGVPSVMNPADRTALECALRIRDQQGGTITAISMGPRQAMAELETALRLGADRAVLLCDRKFSGADTLATGYTLSQAIRRLPHDLILCGVEAVDGCTGQVGPAIGENMGLPAFTYVDDIRIRADGVEITRDTGSCFEVYDARLPLVACVLKKPAERENETETGKAVEIWDAGFVSEERIGTKGSPTRVVSIRVSARSTNYLHVPYDWSLKKRMEHIFNAGIELKKIKLTRGSTEELARTVLDELYRRRQSV